MRHKSIVFFLGISPIVPVAAHFAEGLIFIAEFWCFFAVEKACSILIKRVNIGKYVCLLLPFSIICAALLYVQIIGTLFPVITVGSEQYLYITTFSYILTLTAMRYKSWSYPLEMPITYTILLAVVSMLRELFAFGTVSLPGRSGLFSITLFPGPLTLRFLGSSAGIVIAFGIAVGLLQLIEKGIRNR